MRVLRIMAALGLLLVATPFALADAVPTITLPAGGDVLIPPPEEPGAQLASGAPSSKQTSEFMAGKVVYSVFFVESSEATGNCSPADAQSENWTAPQQTAVLSEISAGLSFWTSRKKSPKPLSFVLDNQGVQATSCEPITRPSSQHNLWVADALTSAGFPTTRTNHVNRARSFAASRRMAFGADWAYSIFVVNSLNDVDGEFPDGEIAFAYLNGPYFFMTYDNDGAGIDNMDAIAAHETGHIFGALDEYVTSGCSTADSWGYLNASNASCNNGGITTDDSIMDFSRPLDPSIDVSTSARGAIGWRNPNGKIVDVIRTATVSLTPFTPDPTTDRTPTYTATAGNIPFPPGGCNTIDGVCLRQPSAVTISKVVSAQWKLDAGTFTSAGVVPSDGVFDEETGESYMFTPPSPVAPGTHAFRTRSINNFGHRSGTKKDALTIT